MRKCIRCIKNNEEERSAKEAQLWKDMIDSLMQFTQTSTALMKGMQNKLGVQNKQETQNKLETQTDNEESMHISDVLEQIKEDLSDIEFRSKSSVVCTCIASQTLDKNDTDKEDTVGIDIYKEPKLKKKRKFKYSSSIESKYLTHRKPISKCQCNKESSNLSVDACLCKVITEKLNILDDANNEIISTTVCSELLGEEIDNIFCLGEIPEEMDAKNKESGDPLAWIPQPRSFFPDKLPQDDNNPLIIKTDDNLEIPNNSLGYELWNAMRKYETNTARIFEYSHESETYYEYAKKIVRVAMKLRDELDKEDIIGILTENHKNAFVPYVAGLLNGNVVVAFDRLLDKKQLQKCLKNVTPSIMFVSDHELAFLKECMRDENVNFKIVFFGDTVISGLTNFRHYDSDGDSEIVLDNFEVSNTKDVNSTCLICFSGGATDRKAVCLSHYTILRQSLLMISSQHVMPITMSFLELYQISSLLILFSTILSGSTRVIIRNFDEFFVWLLVQKYEVNSVHVYPQHLISLSDLPEPDEDTSSLFYVFTAGERLKLSAVKRLKRDLLKTEICQSYESTEMGGFITMFDFSKTEDGILNYFVNESCGRPIEGVWYKVVDLKTGKILPKFTPGELFVKPKTMRHAYFVENKEKPCTGDDWISTGDYVYYDNYQCFHFVSRICDLIRFKDNIIVPSKLENILLSHHSVLEAVVYPMSHAQDGQHAAAVVSVKEAEDIYMKDLEDWVNNRLPKHEQLTGGLKIVGKIFYTSNDIRYHSAKNVEKINPIKTEV